MSASASAGASKSGAVRKDNAPPEGSIEKRAASAPPAIEKVSDGAGVSGSVATTVVTAVSFSATLTAADAPPPSLVITGGSSSGPMPSWIVTVVAPTACAVPLGSPSSKRHSTTTLGGGDALRLR